MTDKLEALSQPVAYDYQIAGACVSDYPNPLGKWIGWQVELSRECPPNWMIEEGKVKDLKPRYSQEYVTALLAALEEKDQRIAELQQRLQQPIKLPKTRDRDGSTINCSSEQLPAAPTPTK